MSEPQAISAVLALLNVVQVVALAYIAAKYRASNGNGPQSPKS